MTDLSPPSTDPQAEALALVEGWSRHAGQAMQRISDFWLEQWQNGQFGMDMTALAHSPLDPLGLVNMWSKVGTQLLQDPDRLNKIQQAWFADALKLTQAFMGTIQGQDGPHKAIRDKRFSAKEWSENHMADFIRQSYLLASKYVNEVVMGVKGVDPHTREKATFYTRQMLDALAPSNFLLTNPQALQTAIETKGESLVRGLENLLADLERGRISMTDEKAFEVGGNVAVTPGKVIFENRLFQLIQYAPTTKQVQEVPLLIFPPWINKFYILDLTAEKSMVKWLTDQGFTTFVVSWVNPDSSYAEVSFEDYMNEGELTAINVVREALGVDRVNVVGYCVAGTLLATTLAYLHGAGKADCINTATFFTAQVDFTEAGDLRMFVDEDQLALVDRLSKETGYLDSSYMAQAFNMLRANDLIWNYVVSNYLLGKEPFPFDLLYWNNDSTRLARAMHLYYLSNMYEHNLLVKPNALTMNGVPIDLRNVTTPTYIQAGKEDHIAPARSVYKMTQHFKGPLRFTLAGSGHIAGVVNPPAQKKYQHWTNEQLPATYDAFLRSAQEHPGSWWPDWVAWLKPQSGAMVAARVPGAGPYPALADAPGSYVKAR